MEKVTCFTSPDRLPISGAALPVSNSGGSTAPGLFLTWCLRPRPNVGVVVSPDCAGTLAFKHGRRARRTSGTEEFVFNSLVFSPDFAGMAFYQGSPGFSVLGLSPQVYLAQ